MPFDFRSGVRVPTAIPKVLIASLRPFLVCPCRLDSVFESARSEYLVTAKRLLADRLCRAHRTSGAEVLASLGRQQQHNTTDRSRKRPDAIPAVLPLVS